MVSNKVEKEEELVEEGQLERVEEEKEIEMVASTYTVVDPRTMVVKHTHTSMAMITMFGTRRLIVFTFSTDLSRGILLIQLQ